MAAAAPGAGSGIAMLASVPVAAAANGGISRLTEAPPSAGPIAAVRRLTDCSTKPASSRAPTAYARGGLPSTEISATPCPLALAAGGPLGAITPCKRNRDACGAAATGAAVATDDAPSKRVKSPRTAAVPVTATECAGAVGARTRSFSDQYTTPAATKAQTKNAESRANMV